ncbi:hypothetical protein I7I50_08897 [Histoplasma capsulatum G186AR]|uniref:Uncharacterized protein n=1 Tax=Ajellomyces capsulatus TaxID=5037 RepID=A0A8H7YP64_AJECA|nr:hypothetical protein I7I52_06413 [Histoplasma capsulatum]QSS73942.1 hypothetical protein I7I50_08897 [Histoplasma capsulatum G186AR]
MGEVLRPLYYQHRVGETRGLKLVSHTEFIQELTIATKRRRRDFELQRLARWYSNGGRMKASREKSEATVRHLEEAILSLERRKSLKPNHYDYTDNERSFLSVNGVLVSLC